MREEQRRLLETSSRSLGELMTSEQWLGQLLVSSGMATMPPCKNVYDQLDAWEEIAVKAYKDDPNIVSKISQYLNVEVCDD